MRSIFTNGMLRQVFLLLGLALLSFSCGSPTGSAGAPTAGGGGSTPVPIELPSATSSLADLPRASSPVAVTAGGNLAADYEVSKAVNLGKGATTGFSVLDTIDCKSSNNYATCKIKATDSKRMCGHMNEFNHAINAQFSFDFNFCFVQNVLADTSALGVTIDDNAFHILSFSGSSTEHFDEMKIRIKKDDDGNITEAEYFGCLKNTQIDYAKITKTSSVYTLSGASKNSTGGSRTSLSAGLNSSSVFTGKTVAYTDVSSDNQSVGTITQTNNTATVSAYDYADTSTTTFPKDNRIVRYYGISQLIDGNEVGTVGAKHDPTKYAIGDGAGKENTTYVFQNIAGTESDDSEGWDGDSFDIDATKLNDATFSPVKTATLPEAQSDITVNYATAEQWNCAGTSEATVTYSNSTITSECGKFDVRLPYIDCEGIAKSDPGGGLTTTKAIAHEVDNISNTITITELGAGGTEVLWTGGVTDAYFDIFFDKELDQSSITTSTVYLEGLPNAKAIYFEFPAQTADGYPLRVHLGTDADDTTTLLTPEDGTRYRFRLTGADENGVAKSVKAKDGSTLATQHNFDFWMNL